MTFEELTGRVAALENTPKPRCAVLVPVVEDEGGLSLLFEVRAATLRRQPGEVCFPGGAMEPDESAETAALRETAEELGLPAELVELGSRLPLQNHRAGFQIQPVLGRLRPGWREHLRRNPDEVAEVFTVPLDFFQTTPPERYDCELVTVPPEDFPAARLGFPEGYPWHKGKHPVLIWTWRGHAIWGLTARMVDSLVSAL